MKGEFEGGMMQNKRTIGSKTLDALVILGGLYFVVLGFENQEWITTVLGGLIAASGIGLWVLLARKGL